MNFNPRPREEGDPAITIESTGSDISIHALVKRATMPALDVSLISFYFNPRPREEGDFSCLIRLYCNLLYFNPRPREEGDRLYRL